MRVLLGRDEIPRRRTTLRLLFEPRDFWVGVFWNRSTVEIVDPEAAMALGARRARFLLVYVCLVPCLPIAIARRIG